MLYKVEIKFTLDWVTYVEAGTKEEAETLAKTELSCDYDRYEIEKVRVEKAPE